MFRRQGSLSGGDWLVGEAFRASGGSAVTEARNAARSRVGSGKKSL